MKIPVKATSERQYTLDRYADAGRFRLVSGDAIYRYLYMQFVTQNLDTSSDYTRINAVA